MCEKNGTVTETPHIKRQNVYRGETCDSGRSWVHVRTG